MNAAGFLDKVRELTDAGMNQLAIAKTLGMKTTTTLMNRLMRASQESGKPVPIMARKRVSGSPQGEWPATIKRRGKGEAYGVNIPMQPLQLIGAQPGDRLRISASKGRIQLRLESEDTKEAPVPAKGRGPRLIKRQKATQPA